MKMYECRISILNEEYMDDLIVALCRQGYSVYTTGDEVIFLMPQEEISEIQGVDVIQSDNAH